MSVLIVTSSNARRGAEIKAVQLAQALREKGAHVRIVALAEGQLSSASTLEIEVLGGRPLGASTLSALRSLARQADVVIAYGSTTLPACALSTFGLATPFVYRSIGDLTAWIRGPLHRWRTRLLLHRAAAVVFLWPGALETTVREMSLRNAKCTVIPDAAGAEFRPATAQDIALARDLFGVDPDRRVVGIIGALTPEKRVDLAIRAVALMPDTTLLVAGDGPLRDELEVLARTIARGQVIFIGAIADVLPVYDAIEILLLTSVTEGMPAVVLEATACGLPVVATRVGALDWMQENVMGSLMLVDVNATSTQIADSLRHGAGSRGERENGANRSAQWSAVTNRWEELLVNVADPSAEGRDVPVRVLAVMDSTFGGGAELSMAALAPALRDHGVTMEVAYFHDRPGAKEHFLSNGVPLHHVPMRRTRLATVMALRRLIIEREPHVVHTLVFEADVIGRTAGFLARRPVISSIISDMYGKAHMSNQPFKWRVRLAQLADIATARLVRRFHAISETVAVTTSKRLLIRSSKTDVIYRGRDLESITKRAAARPSRAVLGLPQVGPLVLCIGRHEPQKDIGTAISSMPRILEDHPDAHLVIAGRDGSATKVLRERASDDDVKGRIHFLGHRNDIPELLGEADVLIFPSLWEGLAGTLIEAMTVGAPIVCSDLPVLREVVSVGGANNTTTFVKPGATEEFAAAVIGALHFRSAARASAAVSLPSGFGLDRAAALHAAQYRRVSSN